MNNMVKKWLGGLALLAGTTNACFAVYINDTNAGTNNGLDVGSIDTFIAQGPKQGNPTNELAWANTYLDPDGSFMIKTGDVGYFSTNASGVYAFELVDEPGWYILKNATWVALFENVASLHWGVFDTNDIPVDMNLPSDSFTISHVTQIAGGSTSAPEPTALALLGAGLVGIGLSRRNKKQ